MKVTYYFSHDYYARNDPKMEEMFLKMGCEGRGIFWTLIEMLYENKGYLPLDNKLEYYANALHTQSECIASIINDYGLFKNDGNRFWSESCLERLKRMEEKSEKARQSSFKRWGKDGKKMRTHCDSISLECDRNAIKDNKTKDNKEKKIIEDILSDLNTLLSSTYKVNSPKTQELIKARLKEGFTVEDFKAVHRKKVAEWGKNPEMAQFLRPITLYSSKFESYLNQKDNQENQITVKREL